MKRMKKLFAMLLAFTMVLGMTMTASAETTKPDEDDSVVASVQNVEANAEVKAYQIIKGDYGTNGFLGYKEVTPTKGILVDIIDGTYLDKEEDLPTAGEVTTIAAEINAGTLEFANVVTMKKGTVDKETGLATYTGNLKAGYWVVLVRGTTNVYNPMLIGVYYDSDSKTDGIQGSGDNNTLAPNPSVDATSKWKLVATEAYAKSSAPTIEKTANVQTQNVGGTVEYTINTQIPDYSKEYTTAKFEVKDTLTNLVLQKDSIVVKVAGEEVKVNQGVYDISGNEEGSTTFTVAFKSAWLLEKNTDDEGNVTDISANAGKTVEITYKATVTEDAINTVAGTNKAELTYTRNPGDDNGHDEDIEKVYSFDIDAGVTKRVITKVKEGVEEGKTAPLAGATFKLYTDAACTTEYSNTSNKDGLTADGVVSDDEGQLHISGLNAGTYYLKETKAPTGYSLNDTVYKIEIEATIDAETDELTAWSIKVTNMTTNEVLTNNFTVNNGVANVSDGTIDETKVMNIQLIALPSTGGIGTTIFTVAGCGIMIAAAFFFFAGRKKEN